MKDKVYISFALAMLILLVFTGVADPQRAVAIGKSACQLGIINDCNNIKGRVRNGSACFVHY